MSSSKKICSRLDELVCPSADEGIGMDAEAVVQVSSKNSVRCQQAVMGGLVRDLGMMGETKNSKQITCP